MSQASVYSAIEPLFNGAIIEIRALRHEDRDKFLSSLDGVGNQSLHRRFFALKRQFSEKEKSFFLDVDFVNHVALVAISKGEGEPDIIGGARYIVEKPGQAEIAVTVVDKYQGQGIGSALIRHLARIAREAGLHQLTAQVLPENTAMLKVIEKCGLQRALAYQCGTVQVVMQLK